jgi:hypothetical protein
MPEFVVHNRSGFRGLAAIGGLIATACALIVGAVLAVFFAATMAVVAVMGGMLLGLAGLALRARRTVRARRPADANSMEGGVIEARRIGGHQWVAYGWNERP